MFKLRQLRENFRKNFTYVEPSTGYTILHYMAYNSDLGFDLQTIRNAVKNGYIDVGAKNEAGQTALHLAAGKEVDDRNNECNMRTLKYIIELMSGDKCKGIIDAQDEKGYTALHWATSNMNKKFVDVLLKSGADVSVKGNNGQKALDVANNSGVEEIYGLLLSHESNKACTCNDKEVVIKHQEDNGDLELLAEVALLLEQDCQES